MKALLAVVCFVVGVPLVALGLVLSLPFMGDAFSGQFPSPAELAVSVPFWVGVAACVGGKRLWDDAK